MPLLFAAIAAGSVAVLAVTQELRQGEDLVNTVRIGEELELGAPGSAGRVRVRFRLAEPDSRAKVMIVDREGQIVATLLHEAPLDAGDQAFRWDGRGPDGEPVEVGRYHVRVDLGELDREIEVPGMIRARPRTS